MVGALKYIISNCESFNNKVIPEEGYYDEWGYYHYPTEVTDDGTENRDDILSKLLENKCAEIILRSSPVAAFSFKNLTLIFSIFF